MKKIFTLLVLVLCSLSAFATGETFKVWLNNGATEYRSDGKESTFFTVAGSYNAKYKDATYDGVDFTMGLKLDSSGKVTFTTAAKSTVTFVQSTSTNGTKLIKFDGTNIPQSQGEAGTNYIEYVIENVEKGEHTFAKGDGESGLFYVKVVYTEEVATETKVATPAIAPIDPTDFSESINVTITCETSDANIFYSTDGENYSAYTNAINLTETTTVYAKATKTGLEDSDVSSLTFNKVDATLGAAVDSKIWTFDSFEIDKNYKVSQTIDGITVYGSTSKWVTAVSGNGSMDDISFTRRIKLNGTSSETERLLVFKVAAGTHKITVYGNSGSSGKSRSIILSTGSWNAESTISKSVDTLDKLEYELVSETETTCYVGCIENIQIAGIVVEPVVITSVPVTIAACGYGTLVSEQALDFESNNYGVTAYIATGMSNGKVQTQEVTKVPANTGIILKGTEGTFEIPVLSGDADDVSDNKMMGSATTATTLAANQGYILYTDGKFHPCNAGDLPAGKAYLNIEASSSKVLDIDIEDPTAITAVESELQTGAVYTLQGVRVSNAAQKGVYIVNGKKVVK